MNAAGVTGGLSLMALGVLLLLDATDTLHLSFGVIVPVVVALAGVTLLASGLSQRGG